MADYIPGGDVEFNGGQDNFVTYANVNLADLGLVQGGIDRMVSTQCSCWAGRRSG